MVSVGLDIVFEAKENAEGVIVFVIFLLVAIIA